MILNYYITKLDSVLFRRAVRIVTEIVLASMGAECLIHQCAKHTPWVEGAEYI